jgi:hypothetical protein
LHLQSSQFYKETINTKKEDLALFQTLLNMSAATVTRTAANAATRRPVSFFMQVRRMGRSFEHHPYERLSVTMKPARPDYIKEITWVAGKMVV